MRGARKVLHHLSKRHRMGLVTSGDRDRVEGQLRKFELLSYSVRGSVEGRRSGTSLIPGRYFAG